MNILTKTLLATLTSLTIILWTIDLYNYRTQSDIITTIQSKQKEYIIKQLNDVAEDKIIITTTNLMKLSKILKSSLANALYNLDNTTIKDNVLKFLLDNEITVAVLLFDNMANDINIVGIQYNQNVEFLTYIPDELKELKFLEYNMIFEDDNIGYVKVYYDTSKIIEQIEEIKKENLVSFEEEATHIKERVSKELKNQVFVFIIAGIIFATIIFIVIRIVVTKPLIEFQRGLNSFFNYLEDPTKEVVKIKIHSNDEFGEMTKSVNESINVSMKMHNNIANLMQIMDKNVITSETDEYGRITYVSQAFCNISGYTKEELLGKSHKIVRHADVSEKVFQDLWKTIKANKIWKGEIKNLKKDGSFYWVYTIISPKCTQTDDSCGFTAIRYDITNRKEVEDLTVNLEIKIQERTVDLEKAKKEVELIHKHTKDSIKYASLIQSALIPQTGAMKPFFKDHFVTWTPKDTVGGDIWLFDELRNKDESLLFFIDCTGHGVPGAFVTMIVKSIEREIVAKIQEHSEFDISPAIIMGYFNKTMKRLLRQESTNSLSNAGFDGGIIYYNKKTQILKFAGAETALFYTDPDGTFHTLKGNRYSVGYKKCDINYEYKESIIDVKEGMKFYCTTDGYLDQNGGKKDFPFGKKRFSKIIEENHTKSMSELQTIFQTKLNEYESEVIDNDRNDDITLIGFEIGK